MTDAAGLLQSREFAFTDAEFTAIAERARRGFGLDLQPEKRNLVYSRLARRLRALGLRSFRDYLALLDRPEGRAEQTEMLSALTTNVTHFFREQHHFDQLRDTVLPPLLAAARSGGRVRLWSAGCSSGQEPWSLALTVLGLMPDAASRDVRILATDVDPAILARASAGRYPAEEKSAIPDASHRFLSETPDGEIAIAEAARALVRFAPLNLIGDWPMRGPFDAIFCRNVAIYFDKPTQAALWARFAPMVAPGGYLFIGHSERLSGAAADYFASTGITSYRKTSAPTETSP